jgi:hypothetical protein
MFEITQSHRLNFRALTLCRKVWGWVIQDPVHNWKLTSVCSGICDTVRMSLILYPNQGGFQTTKIALGFRKLLQRRRAIYVFLCPCEATIITYNDSTTKLALYGHMAILFPLGVFS